MIWDQVKWNTLGINFGVSEVSGICISMCTLPTQRSRRRVIDFITLSLWLEVGVWIQIPSVFLSTRLSLYRRFELTSPSRQQYLRKSHRFLTARYFRYPSAQQATSGFDSKLDAKRSRLILAHQKDIPCTWVFIIIDGISVIKKVRTV